MSRARELSSALALTLLTLALARPALAQTPLAENAIEAPLELEYGAWVDTTISALYHDDRFYFPVVELFERLHIDASYDADARVAQGFFLNAQRRWRLDADSLTLRVANATIHLASGDLIAGLFDLYLPTDVLARAFGLELQVDMSTLTAGVRSAAELPVALAARRRYLREMAAAGDTTTGVPLLFPRDRSLLAGPVLDYSISAIPLGPQREATYRFAGGAEVLGGGLTAEIAGYTGHAGGEIIDHRVQWHYVFQDDARWLTQAALGRVRSTGLQPYEVDGVSFTNAPVPERRLAGSYLVQGQVDPGWEVELYLDRQLVAFEEAGPDGRYRFRVPLRYGTSQLEVRIYGPAGQVLERHHRVQVPFAFLPGGETEWSLTAGRVARTDASVAQARVDIGLTDRLTNAFGLDWSDDSAATRSLVPYDRLSARVGDPYLVSATLAPGAYYRLETDAFYASLVTLGFTGTVFDESRLYNPLGLEHEVRGTAFLPIDVGPVPFSVRTDLFDRAHDDGREEYGGGVDVLASLGVLRPFVGYSFQQTERTGLGTLDQSQLELGGYAYLPGGTGWLGRHFGNTLLRASYAHDLSRAQPLRIEIGAGRTFGARARLELNASRDLRTERSRMELRLVWDHPFARSTSSVLYQAEDVYATQAVSGAIAYDAHARDVVFSRREWVGGAAAAVRTFVDLDADGDFDADEPVVENARVRFANPVGTQQAGPGLTYVPDLIPYYRYEAQVDLSRVRNPLWIPAFEEFGFVTDPNRFKQLDIPFSVAGLVEGTVTRTVAGRQEPVPGLRVWLRRESDDYEVSATTFRDGTFYLMGLPPGRYIASPDAEQLEILRSIAVPAELPFEIETTEEGDIVEGLRFVLEPIP